MDNLPELSLYVHLPWCDKRCPYCDFNITTDSLNGSVKELFNALKNDLSQSEPLINQRALSQSILVVVHHQKFQQSL